MIKKNGKKVRLYVSLFFTLFIFLLSTVVTAGSFPAVEKNKDEAEFLDILRQLDVKASQIERYARELDTYIRTAESMMYDWKSHTQQWNRIEEQLEGMTDLSDDLDELKGLNKWQKELVKELRASIAAMTDQANDALKFLEKVQSEVQFANPEYKARVSAIHAFADDIDRMVDYGKTRWEMEFKK